MTGFTILALVLTLAAIFSYINHRFIGLPTTIGLMLISSVLSLVLVCAGQFALPVQNAARQLVDSIDFGKTLLGGTLSFLLFAAAINVDLRELREEKWSVTMLASASVVLSTAIIGILSLWIFGWVGLNICLICCFLFGALISPTDPIRDCGTVALGLCKR